MAEVNLLPVLGVSHQIQLTSSVVMCLPSFKLKSSQTAGGRQCVEVK